MGVLTALGSGVGGYILAMAVLSPCPVLLDGPLGASLMVSGTYITTV